MLHRFSHKARVDVKNDQLKAIKAMSSQGGDMQEAKGQSKVKLNYFILFPSNTP
jgi:hypothetical protein